MRSLHLNASIVQLGNNDHAQSLHGKEQRVRLGKHIPCQPLLLEYSPVALPFCTPISFKCTVARSTVRIFLWLVKFF